MNPINENKSDILYRGSKIKKRSSDSFSVMSVAFFVLLAIGVIIFLYNQNQTLKEELSNYRNLPSGTPYSPQTPSFSPSSEVTISASPIISATPKNTATSPATLK